MFYVICNSLNTRNAIINELKKEGILSVFHYLSLHKSAFYHEKHDGRELTNSDHFTDTLLRLPMYYELTDENVAQIVNLINNL